MKATPLLQKVCASGHFVRHSTYTGALMCNSSRGKKSEFSAALRGPPPGVLVEDSDYFRWLDSGRGKAGPLAAFGWYSPKCVEGEFSEVGLPLYGVLRTLVGLHAPRSSLPSAG